MADHMTAEQLRAEILAYRQALQDADMLRFDDDTPLVSKWVEKRVAELVAARLSGMAADTWKPIETAPKHGRVLLAYKNAAGLWRRVVASYYDEDDVAEWENGDMCEPGWYERSEAHEAATETVYAIECSPMFWQHLPAAPEPPHV